MLLKRVESMEERLQMPVFEIDREAKDCFLQLYDILSWPHDLELRKDHRVTVAAWTMHYAEDVIPRFAEEISDFSIKQAQSAGIVIDPVMLKATALERGRLAVQSIQAELTNDLLRPNGGFGRLATAPGLAGLLKSAMENGGKFGRACGELLIYIAGLHKHHPQIEPSINRALHIMVNGAKKEARHIPAERDRATMWSKWKGIAPLWAAYLLCGARGHLNVNDIVSGSLWLADFAVNFKPKGSRSALLTEEEVVRISCGLGPVEPGIPPLTPEQIRWARDYKVRP